MKSLKDLAQGNDVFKAEVMVTVVEQDIKANAMAYFHAVYPPEQGKVTVKQERSVHPIDSVEMEEIAAPYKILQSKLNKLYSDVHFSVEILRNGENTVINCNMEARLKIDA